MDGSILALVNDILTAIYVILTLIIVVFTFQSLKATRDALTMSKQQAKESLINQHKPVIVPVLQTFGFDLSNFSMQNKGTGIAMNTWGFLTNNATNKFRRFEFTHFLVPDKQESISVVDISKSLNFLFPDREFKGYSIYSSPDIANLKSTVRLLITYNDIFENKYLVIFDYSEQLGWQQFENVKKVNQRFDEYFVEKRSHVNWEEQEGLPVVNGK